MDTGKTGDVAKQGALRIGHHHVIAPGNEEITVRRIARDIVPTTIAAQRYRFGDVIAGRLGPGRADTGKCHGRTVTDTFP